MWIQLAKCLEAGVHAVVAYNGQDAKGEKQSQKRKRNDIGSQVGHCIFLVVLVLTQPKLTKRIADGWPLLPHLHLKLGSIE
jgi:hypothetical protein